MKYKRLKDYPDDRFRRITGVKRETFEKMCAILKTAYDLKHMRRGRKPKLPLEDTLLAALEYLREYRTYAHIAASYGIAEVPFHKVGRGHPGKGRRIFAARTEGAAEKRHGIRGRPRGRNRNACGTA